MRLQVGSSTTPNFSSVELFPDVLEPLLRSNKTVVDMSCVAADAEFARQYVWLPYLILRSWIMTAEHFQADYIAAAVRPPHQLFYQRALNCELHCELRQPPHHVASVGLVTLNFATSVKRLTKNSHFFAPRHLSDNNSLSTIRAHQGHRPRSLRARRTMRLSAKE